MTHYLQDTCNDLKIQAQARQGLEGLVNCNTCTTAAIATVKKQFPSSLHFAGLSCSHCHLWLKWLPKPKVDATSILAIAVNRFVAQ